MQVIRTTVWIAITALLVSFIAMNWNHAPVNFWPLGNGDYLHFEWPVGLTALLFFLLGLLPMWLLSRAGKWRLNRRISSLENSLAATTSVPSPPLATSTQFENQNPEVPTA